MVVKIWSVVDISVLCTCRCLSVFVFLLISDPVLLYALHTSLLCHCVEVVAPIVRLERPTKKKCLDRCPNSAWKLGVQKPQLLDLEPRSKLAFLFLVAFLGGSSRGLLLTVSLVAFSLLLFLALFAPVLGTLFVLAALLGLPFSHLLMTRLATSCQSTPRSHSSWTPFLCLLRLDFFCFFFFFFLLFLSFAAHSPLLLRLLPLPQ